VCASVCEAAFTRLGLHLMNAALIMDAQFIIRMCIVLHLMCNVIPSPDTNFRGHIIIQKIKKSLFSCLSSV